NTYLGEVETVGDVNGDGIEDILIGSGGVVPFSGISYLVFGSGSLGGSTVDLDALDGSNGYRFADTTAIDAGGPVNGEVLSGAGDLNGDGLADLLLGAPRFDSPSGSTNFGQGTVIFGGTGQLSQLDALDSSSDGLIDLANIGNSVFGDLVTDEDTVLSFAAADLTRNDIDPEGETITVTAVDSVSTQGIAIDFSNGQITYDPGAAFQSLSDGQTQEDSFTYTITAGSRTAQGTVNLSILGVNDDPIGIVSLGLQQNRTDRADTLGPENGDFTDPDGDVLTFTAQLAGGQPLPTFLDNAFQGEDGDFTLDVGDGIGSEGLYRIETDVSDGNGGLLELDYYLVTNGVDIFGTAVGEELVTASSGGVSELFRSGQGRDRMQGGDGTDIYVYTSGDDFDAILDNGFGDNDALLFEDLDRITASFSRFIPEEDDLLVRFDDQDQIRVVGGLSASLNQNIETYNFADGTSLTPAEIRALIVEQQGTGGDDTIFGFSAGEVDVLIGGLGNDVKTGGDGSDDYRYTLGDGEDVIDDNGFFDTDRLFIEGVSQGQLSFSRRGFDINDLLIGMRDGGSIHVVGALNGSSNDEIEEYVIVDDAATLTAQDLREIIIARATSEGADSIRGFSEADDTINGGAGDDLLIGSGGSDLYVYDFSGDGDGSDTIFDDGFASTDILRLDNLLASRAEFRQEFGSNTLEIDLTLAGGPVIETIKVVNQLEGSSSDQIEQVVFSQEGITLTAADLRDEVIAQQLLDGSATLSGFTTSADTLTADSNTLFMTGGSEGDTYQVDASNSGLVVIEDNGNNTEDRLEFSNVFGALSATRAIDDLNDLVLTADIFAVRIVNGLDNTNADTIEIVQEGTVGDTTIADLRARVIAGENTSGNDVIFGTSSDDSITLDTGEDFVDLSSGGGDTLTHRAGTGGKLIFTNTDSAADRLILSGTSSTDIELITLAFAQDVVSIDNTVQDESTILLNGLDALAFETVELDDLTLTGTEFVDAVAANANGFDSETGDDTANTLFAGASALDHVALSGLGADDTYDVITDASFGTPSAGLVEIFDNAFSNNDLLVLSGFSVDAYTIEIVASNKDGSNSLDALDEGDLRIGTPNDTDIIIHNAFSPNGRIENFRFTSAFGSEDLTLAEVRDIAIANQFTANDDTVVGTELAELIQAADGGQDVLRGLAGNDTYAIDEIFNQSVVIDDSSSSGGDVLEISGLDFADAVFSRVPGDEDDLVISDPTVFNRTILIKNTLNSNFVGAIETIRFDDQDIDLATVRSTIFQQELSDLGDTVIGSTVADTLFSSLGDDVLNGRNGADIYQIDTRNIGTVIIDDGAGGGDDQVILNFASAATTEFSQDPLSTDDLILDFGGRRTVTIQNTLSDNFVGGIATLTFDDGTGLIQSLSMLDVRNIILDNAATTGNDRISAFTVADTIDAGEGNDLLEGRDGSDTYVFNPGDGQDIIDDNGSFDTDVLDLGFETSDLVLGRGGAAGNDILLQFQSSTDQVTVINGYSGGQQDGIEQFQFTDATLTTADLRQRFLDAQVTSGDDVIVGFNGAETLSGGEGNDTLIGSTGNDIYLIEIGDGDDLIEDQVTSNSNADEIRFVGRNFADVSFSLLQPGLDEVLIEAGSDQVIVVDAIGSNGAIEFYVFDDLLLTRDEMETLL
ncbi:MAG: cadherin-like domain-containing protein, partial [Pseudomonadota bacterium]